MYIPDEENEIFNIAAKFIRQSNHPVFLTGKAGTGKTTFLKHIRQLNIKNTVIVAPTGVAAMNAGGTTIHSFFSLPLSPFIPVRQQGFQQSDTIDKNSLLAKLKLNKEKIEIMQQLELLIIDEVSMVRCDVMDAIDTVLRHVRSQYSKPFGGVQVLYIGDMYQLPPVIKTEEWQILSNYYSNPFFFNSQVCIENPPVYIELKKVYRQSDEAFISLLNKVRNNEMDEDGFQLLHSRYHTSINQEKANKENIITLTTHNLKADAINETTLHSLPGKEYNFKAIVEGEFYEKNYPAEENLKLKTGAQVMFLKNDIEKTRRYFNGKIGVVGFLSNEKIEVVCNNGNEKIEVSRDSWKTIKYTLNKSKQHIEEEELGSFTQFPLRLAWAITIHKSQGLTFEKAIIDAGQAFSPGQVYVALSRCTCLEGLYLQSNITYNSLRSDERIVEYAKTQQDENRNKQTLDNATIFYQQEILLSLFDFKLIEKYLMEIEKQIAEHFSTEYGNEWIKKLKEKSSLYIKYARRFELDLLKFFEEPFLPEKNIPLLDRIHKAAEWYEGDLKEFINIFLQSPAQTDNNTLAKDFNTKAGLLLDEANMKVYLLAGIEKGFSLDKFLEHKSNYSKKATVINSYSGKSSFVPKEVKHAKLYLALKEKRDELCSENNLPPYMICSTESIVDMSNALPLHLNDLSKVSGFGKHRLKKFGNEFLSIIQEYCNSNNLDSNIESLPVKRLRKTSVMVNKSDTKLISYDLFRQGKNVEEISKERKLAVSTIESHLGYFIETGKLGLHELLNENKMSLIKKVVKENKGLTFSELKIGNPEISYCELHWFAAAEKYNATQLN